MTVSRISAGSDTGSVTGGSSDVAGDGAAEDGAGAAGVAGRLFVALLEADGGDAPSTCVPGAVLQPTRTATAASAHAREWIRPTPVITRVCVESPSVRACTPWVLDRATPPRTEPAPSPVARWRTCA